MDTATATEENMETDRAKDAVEHGWSTLPADVLVKIASKTSAAATYAVLRSVCRHWRLSIPATPRHRLPPQLPLLLFPSYRPEEPVGPAYSLAMRCTRALRHLDDTAWSICVGSSYGWVFLLDPDCNLILRNPFTGDTIRLPSLDCIFDVRPPANSVRRILERKPAMPKNIIRHAILSSDPSTDRDFSAVVFFAIKNSHCFSWRSGEQTWTVHEHPKFIPKEIIFIKDRLCLAIAYNRACATFDFAAAAGGDGFFTIAPVLLDSGSPFLVESAGSVRLVTVKIVRRGEAMVRVYRLDSSRLPDVRTIEEDDLGGRIFFLAHGNSMSVASTDFPGFEGDSIFFTKIDWNLFINRHETYVRTIWEFQIKNRRSRLHDIEVTRFRSWPKPLWVPPNLYGKLDE